MEMSETNTSGVRWTAQGGWQNAQLYFTQNEVNVTRNQLNEILTIRGQLRLLGFWKFVVADSVSIVYLIVYLKLDGTQHYRALQASTQRRSYIEKVRELGRSRVHCRAIKPAVWMSAFDECDSENWNACRMKRGRRKTANPDEFVKRMNGARGKNV
jgi:hypothetical protein